MQWVVLVQQAFRNLWATKMRSFLALLGVLIGTSSVVALIYCGQLATYSVVQQMSSLGTHLLSVTVSPVSDTRSGQHTHLTIAEVRQIPKRHASLQDITPVAFLYHPLSIHGQVVHSLWAACWS